MNVAKNMDSVFDNATNDDLDFDVMFDQDDSLVDLVNGFNEAGDPLTGVDFEDLHQTEDDADVKDVKDVESDDELMGAKNVEGTKEDKLDDDSLTMADLEKDSEADKFIDNADKNYQDGKDCCGPKPDEDSVTDTIDKALESTLTMDDLDDGSDDVDDDSAVDEGCKEVKDKIVSKAKNVKDKVKEKINSRKLMKDRKDDDDDEDIESLKELSLEDLEEEADIDDEDIMGEIDDVDLDELEEAEGFDSDVVNVDNSEVSDEDELIDTAKGNSGSEEEYSYDLSDEELIDDVINS